MEGEGKSLSRLIRNLESDPDIRLARDLKEAREWLASDDPNAESFKQRVKEASQQAAAKLESKIVHETAKEGGLRMLRERVARLNNLLTINNTPHLFIANEITLILQAAALYCPRIMGQALMEFMHDQVCQAKGFCVECGTFIPDNTSRDCYCGECTKKFEARDAAMQEPHPGQ